MTPVRRLSLAQVYFLIKQSMDLDQEFLDESEAVVLDVAMGPKQKSKRE